MRSFQFAVLIGFVVCLFSQASATENTTVSEEQTRGIASCGKLSSSLKPWKYCIYRYPNSSNKVLYYFHGLMGSETTWEKEKAILKRWESLGKQPPTVVTISFGSQWFLAEKNSSSSSGLYEVVMNEVFPTLQNLLGFISEENWLMGESMGGLNASQIYFRHQSMFTKAALICGAMATVSPHASDAEVEAYIQRTGANPFQVYIALSLARYYYPTEADWQKHSPIALAELFLTPESIPIYMSNGLKDKFGFHEGNLAFVDIALRQGTNITYAWDPKAGHCGADSTPIADFFNP